MPFVNLSECGSGLYMEWMSNGRLFQTVGLMKHQDLSPSLSVCRWKCRNYQIRSEDDIRVCIYAAILKDIWNHHQKWQKDIETRPCTESYTILEANGGNREQFWCDVTFCIEPQAQQHHFVPSGAHQGDFWVHLQAGSYNSPVLRIRKQKQFRSCHMKGADKWKQNDAVLYWQMCTRW